MTIQFISSEQDLHELCQTLSHSHWLAVDTEFHREKTYYPQLCLIQVADQNTIACIDPLAINDLSPLLDLFYRTDITLVFHAARQDLELFYLLKNSLPPQIFDTQLAATVLGYGDQIGYGNLVKKMLNVDLDKSQSRTDWRQRPLTQQQIDYAADDVRYLREVYKKQLEELESAKRTSWLIEDFQQLTAIKTYEEDPSKSWLRIKGAGKLKSAQLAILQRLAAWRELLAIKKDLPRKWILKDDVMLDLARFSPNSVDKMKKIRGFEARDIDRYGAELLSHIQTAKQLPKDQWPVIKRPTILSNQQEAIVDAMMSILRKQCDEQSITPSAVATRKDLEALLRGEQSSLTEGWRSNIIGQRLLDFLAGQLQLEINDQQLLIKEK